MLAVLQSPTRHHGVGCWAVELLHWRRWWRAIIRHVGAVSVLGRRRRQLSPSNGTKLVPYREGYVQKDPKRCHE